MWAESLHMWAHDSRAGVTQQLTLSSLKGSLTSMPDWTTPLCLGVEVRGRKRMIWSKTGPLEGATCNHRQPLGAQSDPCSQQEHRDLSPTTTRNSASKHINLAKECNLSTPLFQLCQTLSRGPSSAGPEILTYRNCRDKKWFLFLATNFMVICYEQWKINTGLKKKKGDILHLYQQLSVSGRTWPRGSTLL